MVPLALGFKDPYNLDEEEFEAFEKKLFELRPQIKRLTSGFNDQTAAAGCRRSVGRLSQRRLERDRVGRIGPRTDPQQRRQTGRSRLERQHGDHQRRRRIEAGRRLQVHQRVSGDPLAGSVHRGRPSRPPTATYGLSSRRSGSPRRGPWCCRRARARGSPTPTGRPTSSSAAASPGPPRSATATTEIADAVHAQLRKLHYAGTAEYQADVVFELAEKLAELTPGDLGPCYFTESGTASNEAAFKLARFYQQATGKPRAYKVISRWNAYHGAIGTPMAVSDWLGVRLPGEPNTPGVSFVPGPTCYRVGRRGWGSRR